MKDKSKFKNIVVFITDEQMLQEVREFLEGKGEECATDFSFSVSANSAVNYLQYSYTDANWYLAAKWRTDTEITLAEFKEMFNDRSNG